jgi:hypothetical protein
VLVVDGLRIGLSTTSSSQSAAAAHLEGLMTHFFGGAVNVIVRGSTHAAE